MPSFVRWIPIAVVVALAAAGCGAADRPRTIEVDRAPEQAVLAQLARYEDAMRRMDYDPASIAEWGSRIAEQSWQAVYAYFKHEALGPMFAEALLAVTDGRPMADLSAVRASIAAPKPKSVRGASSKSKSPAARASKAPAVRVSKAPAARATKAPAKRASKAPESRNSKAPARNSKAPTKVRKP